jgi:hypothetical protein
MFMFSRYFLKVIAGASLSIVIGISGCSDKKEEPSKAKVEVQDEQSAKNEPVEQESPVEPHQVDPCERHRYYIDPGSSAIVTFETEIKSDVVKAAQNEEPRVNKEAMEAVGYTISCLSRSIDTFTRSCPVWTVYSSDFSPKERGIVGTSNAGIFIQWESDGTGVIERLEDENGRFEVGKLTREDLEKKLGADTVRVVLAQENKTYNLPPSQGSRDQEINILSVSFNVTVPDDTSKIMQEKIGGVFWKGGGVSFRGYYNNFPQVEKYVITGPAKDRGCFDQ